MKLRLRSLKVDTIGSSFRSTWAQIMEKELAQAAAEGMARGNGPDRRLAQDDGSSVRLEGEGIRKKKALHQGVGVKDHHSAAHKENEGCRMEKL